MATIRVVQGKEDPYPKVLIAETGEPVRGVRSIHFERDAQEFGILYLELATGFDMAEIDVTISVELDQAKRDDAAVDGPPAEDAAAGDAQEESATFWPKADDPVTL